MKRLSQVDGEAGDLDFSDVRAELASVGEVYGIPELAAAYDAIVDAMQAVETHEKKEEIMATIFARMRPLLAQAPQFMMGMMGPIR